MKEQQPTPHDPPTHNPPPHDDIARGHQPDRVSTRGVLTIGAVLAATIIGTLAFLAFLQERLETNGETARPGPQMRQMAEPPAPEHDQPALLRALRQYEQQTLNEYAWQDEDQTVARIPVTRAMEILLQEGFPVEPSPAGEDGAAPPSDAPPPADSPTPAEPKTSAAPDAALPDPDQASPAQTALPADAVPQTETSTVAPPAAAEPQATEPPAETPPPPAPGNDAPQDDPSQPKEETPHE